MIFPDPHFVTAILGTVGTPLILAVSGGAVGGATGALNWPLVASGTGRCTLRGSC